MGTLEETITKLNEARDYLLRDSALYTTIVPGILPIIGQAAHLKIRRWGADFLAETFASPVLNGEAKQKLCVTTVLLDTLRGYMNRKEELGEAEDSSVIKPAVQCAASVYPLVFRHLVHNGTDEATWNKMAAIKSSILRKMDQYPAGIRICCVKFLATVVQVQTPGLIADPRRPEQNEISLALLSRDHSTLKVGTLEAEASGLLDRLLTILQEDSSSALLVTATINSLASLVHRRASISNKIVTALFNFNPFRSVHSIPTGIDRVSLRSVTRTTISFLLNILKRNPQHSLASRIQQQIDRLRHGLGDAFSEANHLKRGAPDEPTDGLNDVKRQRIETDTQNGTAVQQFPPVHPLPSGPITVAQLFDLTGGSAAANFDVKIIPENIVCQLAPALIAAVESSKLDWAINTIRARYLEVTSRPVFTATATDAARAVLGEEDDDYDPSNEYSGDTEKAMNELDRIPSQNLVDHNIKIGPFHLPPPPALSPAEAQEQSKMILVRLFEILSEKDKELKTSKPQEVQRGFNRPSLGPQTREGWIQTVVRIATRAPHDVEDLQIKLEEDTLIKKDEFELTTGIREALFNYIMEDFRRHINDAIRWFSEEWYIERLAHKEKSTESETQTPRYTYWTLRYLDAIVPYLDIKDNRILIRFFSEIPNVNAKHLSRLVKVADDPERVNLAVQTLLYLVMLRPPVREAALDAMETLWRHNEDAKKSAEKHLIKWRPDVVSSAEVKVEA